MSFILLIIKMSENTLQFHNIFLKTEFHKSKQSIDINLVNVDQILISGKFRHSNDDFKYVISYKEDEILLNRYVLSYLKRVVT